ncbi:GDP-mannose 4,6-dehydratase [Aquimarina litoralis]|uniref:GDP-mannose 4,6-dehydratase n=1 Tax=Aquimarina litoralis TaxID=584605 RepID=UPI001C55A957|nr:GDP-mannose 4,6-dehydratase [Aquimarina litoralis]MBW1293906.1 NAD-dependent epimerase/dehydratase family protein [Aquimarina litoralis]
MEVPSNKRVFITGISGFTGKHLENYLSEKGFDVYGSSLLETSSKHFKCDILSEESLYQILDEVKPDYVIHLAAISFVAAEDQLNIYNVNVFGTLNLLNAAARLAYTPKKILIASSAAVYGNIEGELNENMHPRPVNHYGNSKLVMENMVKPFFDKLDIIIVRPFNYTGVGQRENFLIPKIVTHFKAGKKEIDLGNIDVHREFNDVSFVTKCYTKLILSDIKSDIFNICTGRVYSIKEILALMSEISGYKIQVNVNPNFVRKNEIQLLKGSTKKLFPIIDDFVEEFNIQKTLLEMFKA